MKTTAQAETSREEAREADGKFGAQIRCEPDSNESMAERPFDIYEHVTWHDDELAVYDMDSLEGLTRRRLSASTSKAIQDCPAKWASERVSPKHEDPWRAAEQGTAVHHVLEKLYNLPANERTNAKAQQYLDELAVQTFPDHTHKHIERVERIRMVWKDRVRHKMAGLKRIEKSSEANVFATELKINDVDLNGVPFVGFIDRVDEIDGGGLKTIDLKTAKKMPVLKHGDFHGDQVRLYSEALKAKYGRQPAAGSLFYTQVGKERAVDLSAEAVADTLSRFKQSWEDLQEFNDTGLYPAKPSPSCIWCPVKDTCPSGNREGFANPAPPEDVDDGYHPE